MKKYTYSELDKMSVSDLDNIYLKMVGYKPIEEDKIKRNELVNLILEHQYEIVLAELQSKRATIQQIEHPFFELGATAYRLPDKTMVFIYPSEDSLDSFMAWYTGMEITDINSFLDECRGDKHSALGSGFCDTWAEHYETTSRLHVMASENKKRKLNPVNDRKGIWINLKSNQTT
jgi:hypothetical protein